MRLLPVLVSILSLPALAQDLDLSGRWEGTITTVGTRLQSTYSPITGVTLSPVPDVQVMPSPFGPLDLRADGTWEMPVLELTGDWSLEGTALDLTGGPKDAAARVERLASGPVVVIDFDIGEGEVQTVTFTRAP